MRHLLQVAVSFFEKEISAGRVPLVVVDAPTGYGKTSAAPKFFEASMDQLSTRLIHVLPMRSLIKRAVSYAREQGLFRSLGIGDEQLGYQASIELGEPKSPQFLSRVVYSTFDSFVYNLFKLNVAESIWKDSIHYEVPRGMIFTATVGLDEVHLYGGDPGAPQPKGFDALIASIAALAKALVPTYVLSATMPRMLIEEIKRRIDGIFSLKGRLSVGVFVFDAYARNLGNNFILDEEYLSQALNTLWRTSLVGDEEEFGRMMLEEVGRSDERRKMLVVRNTPEKAAETYNFLVQRAGLTPGRDTVLLHGRMCQEDREKAEEVLDRLDSARVVVATQVIEAGVTISGASILFTDAAAPTSLAQRAGRLARNGETEADVVVLQGDGDGVYEGKLVRRTCELISAVTNGGRGIDWRVPTVGQRALPNGLTSYKTIIEEAYAGEEVQSEGRLQTHLEILDEEIHLGARDAKIVESHFCGLVRESLLVPVYVGPLDGNSAPEDKEIERWLVTCSLGWLAKRFDRIIEKGEDGFKAILSIRRRGETYKAVGHVKLDDFLSAREQDFCAFFTEHIRRLKPLVSLKGTTGVPQDASVSLVAFVCREGVYLRGLGLLDPI